MTNWAEEEFETLSLGDARLERRAVILTEQLAQKPGLSIPQACGDWGQTQAAYRFLANEDTSGQSVLQAHADVGIHGGPATRSEPQRKCCLLLTRGELVQIRCGDEAADVSHHAAHVGPIGIGIDDNSAPCVLAADLARAIGLFDAGEA